MHRSSIIDALSGRGQFDTVIKNVKFVNIITKEIYDSEIGIVGGKVAHINQPGEIALEGIEEYDAEGRYAIPGLIDTHVHIESSMMTPANMAKAVLVHGTTAIACDPHEVANVSGIDGVRYIVESTRKLLLKVYVLAPSCVPSVVGIETAGANFNREEIDEIMSMEGVIGLGEVMDFQGVISQNERIMDILDTARKHTRFLQGHAPSLTGRDLSAYLSTGICSCHETSFEEEARYKLRAGMTLECRESSIVHDIDVLVPVLKEFGYPPAATFCTDDREPDDLLDEGHLDYVLRKAVKAGMPPIEAVRMATYNAAKLLDIEGIGHLKPGNAADIVLLDNLEEFIVNEVFVNGELTVKNGKMISLLEKKTYPIERINSVILDQKLVKEDFGVRAEGSEVKVNVIAFNPKVPIVTNLSEAKLPVKNGFADISGREDLSILSVFERHGVNGNKSTCFVKNLGLTHGAIASTVSHDSHNLVVIGKNTDDMLKAAEALIDAGGGIVCVSDGRIEVLLKLPIAGLMSDKPVEELAPLTADLKRMIYEHGIKSVCPILQIGSLALPVIPSVRLTDCGLVDVASQKIIPIIID